MARQLSFDLPARVGHGREDFFVSPANATALAMVEDPGRWSAHALALTGPAGSGKTHLAHIWATATGARIVSARDLGGTDVPELATSPIAVEDVPEAANDTAALTQLFHLYNATAASRQPLLMTGRAAPRDWNLPLADIQSRVQAAAHARLDPPDDTLLSVLLVKLFTDRQITPKPDVIPYLLPRMDRSFDAAQRIVERLDRMALDESRTLSRSLAARALGPDDAPETPR